MPRDKKSYLDALEIPIWRAKKQTLVSTLPIELQKETKPQLDTIHDNNAQNFSIKNANLNWIELQNKVKACQLCELCKTRTQTVFGVGNEQADLLLVGEAPGANEDLQGEPFVGRGGMLLTSMIKSIGLERNKVYIANILKCRPPNNRDPSPSEVQVCTPFLREQIALIKPKLIVAVGRIAAQFLLNTEDSMASLRGRIHSYQVNGNEVPLMVIYHPAYLLRSPREKRKAYLDMLAIEKMIAQGLNS
jgi:uracil-DNA glycosylase